MTIDDESSIYIGGLPYNATEETLRRVFDIYGAIVAVKLINDRGVGGKCYGFVTFTNPRSAVHAIEDMDGKTIDGRVIKVNEVKTRGARLSFGHEGFRRHSERGLNRSRDRDDRDRYRDRRRERSQDRDQDRERGYERSHDRTLERFADRDKRRDQDIGIEDFEHENARYYDEEPERDRDQDQEIKRTSDYHKDGENDNDYILKLPNGSKIDGRHTRELSLESSDEDHDEIEKQLEISNQRVDELQKEISTIEELAKEKRELVLKLREKSQKLEDDLATAKTHTSDRQMQLTKLHKCFQHLKDYGEKLKSSEQELQSLAGSMMLEME